MVVISASLYLRIIGCDFGSVFVRGTPLGRNHIVLAVGGRCFEVDDTLNAMYIRCQILQNTGGFSFGGQKRADANMP